MLYLIVPPIVIIVSLGLLLFLLSRKSSEFSEIKKEKSFSTGNFDKNRKIGYSRISHFFLRILEGITKRFKSLLLEFHNVSDKWFQKIKEERNKSKDGLNEKYGKPEKEQEKELPGGEADIPEFGKVIQIEPEKEQEKEISPMISDEIVKPEPEIAAKEELEKILVGRIAANPHDIEAYERLGDYYIEQNNYRDAKECYKQVLKLSPINRKAKIRLKKISRALGR